MGECMPCAMEKEDLLYNFLDKIRLDMKVFEVPHTVLDCSLEADPADLERIMGLNLPPPVCFSQIVTSFVS